MDKQPFERSRGSQSSPIEDVDMNDDNEVLTGEGVDEAMTKLEAPFSDHERIVAMKVNLCIRNDGFCI